MARDPGSFDTVARAYGRGRQRYPDALLAALAAAPPGPRVLEIGPGTGQATAALRPGGVLVTVTTQHLAGGTEAFFREAWPVHARHEPDEPQAAALPSTPVPTRDEADDDPAFAPAERTMFIDDVPFDAAGYVALLGTYSNVLGLRPEPRAALLGEIAALVERHGGRIVKRFGYELRVARRR